MFFIQDLVAVIAVASLIPGDEPEATLTKRLSISSRSFLGNNNVGSLPRSSGRSGWHFRMVVKEQSQDPQRTRR
jgi:hypothetical protein